MAFVALRCFGSSHLMPAEQYLFWSHEPLVTCSRNGAYQSVLHLHVDTCDRCEKKVYCWRSSVLAPPSRRPPLGPGLSFPGQSLWDIFGTLEDLVVLLGPAPVLEQSRLGAGPLAVLDPQRDQRSKGWVLWGDSIQEVIPVVRSSLYQCSGEYPNIPSETLGAIGALQAHPV